MNNKFKSLLITSIVILVAVAGIVVYALNQNKSADSTGQANISSAVATDSVTIRDYAFGPTSIKVKKGTKVTWTNQDQVEHTVTTQSGSPTMFDSGLFGKDKTFSYTFEKTGTYQYYCIPHQYMKATVIVTE